MRVISGLYKGKYLEGFNIEGTRPTMDRVKESLFASIQGYIKDSVCLDLFAGSGSLGIEALSNGSSKCYFVDYGKEISKILKKNLEGIKDSEVYFTDYRNALTKFKQNNVKFDVVFLDPPYHLSMLEETLERIKENELMSDNSIIVCEYEEEVFTFDSDYYEVWKEKKYGDKNVLILRHFD